MPRMTSSQVIATATVGRFLLLTLAALIAWRQFTEARELRKAQVPAACRCLF